MRPLVALVLAAALAPVADARAGVVVRLPAGDGTTLQVEDSPLRIALVGADGREQVATFAGATGLPLRPPGLDGPQPVEPLGALGAYPALAWVTGVRAGTTIPVFLWAGNRLFGAEAGGVIAATRVRSAETTATGARLALETTLPGADAHLELERLPGGGIRLRAQPPGGAGAVSSLFTLASPGDEGLYGLGARKDRFDQRGLLRNVWVEQQNAGDERTEPATAVDPTGTTGADYTFPNGPQAAYYVQPALFGSRGWGAWTGGTALQRLDLAASRPDAVRWGSAEPALELTLAGGGLASASRAYTAATGRAPAPPRYVYEPWIDVINEGEGEAAPNGYGFSGGERVRADLEEIVAKRVQHGLPIGVVGIEGWHAIAGGPEFFSRLRAQGLRLAGYWNPFVAPGTPAHEEATRRDLLIEDATGAPFPVLTSRNTVVNVIDFSHPEAADFWAGQLRRSADLGFEAFMHDFGEFVTDGMHFHDGRPVELAHNAYPTLYHRAARRAVDAYAATHPGFAPWFYVRAGHTGTPAATSGVFPGDETTDWSEGSGLPSVIPTMLNLSLTGAYTFTTDVGGYFDFVAPRTSPELLTRWVQLAAFTPVLRLHNSTSKKSVMPWDDPQALEVFRRYSRAKVKLIGLVDRWSRRAATQGDIGPVRPLALEDPSPEARAVDDQWLLGRDLLVAPVVRRGATARRVYLPAGAVWERVVVAEDGALAPTGDVQAGGRTVEAPAPLADIPVYRRVRERRACGSRRRFTIRFRAPRRARPVRKALVRVGDRRPRRARRTRGHRFRFVVDLRRTGRRRLVVRITLVGRGGRVRLPSRVYRPCARR